MSHGITYYVTLMINVYQHQFDDIITVSFKTEHVTIIYTTAPIQRSLHFNTHIIFSKLFSFSDTKRASKITRGICAHTYISLTKSIVYRVYGVPRGFSCNFESKFRELTIRVETPRTRNFIPYTAVRARTRHGEY